MLNEKQINPIIKNEDTKLFEKLIKGLLNNSATLNYSAKNDKIYLNFNDNTKEITDFLKNVNFNELSFSNSDILKYADNNKTIRTHEEFKRKIMFGGGDEAEERFNKLEYGEMLAIYKYTDGSSIDMNNLLRGLSLTQSVTSDISNLYTETIIDVAIAVHGLNKIPDSYCAEVVRYQDKYNIEELKNNAMQNNITRVPFFISTSLDNNTAQEKFDLGKDGVKIVMKNVKAKNIQEISAYPYEQEHLIPPNYPLKWTKYIKRGAEEIFFVEGAESNKYSIQKSQNHSVAHPTEINKSNMSRDIKLSPLKQKPLITTTTSVQRLTQNFTKSNFVNKNVANARNDISIINPEDNNLQYDLHDTLNKNVKEIKTNKVTNDFDSGISSLNSSRSGSTLDLSNISSTATSFSNVSNLSESSNRQIPSSKKNVTSSIKDRIKLFETQIGQNIPKPIVSSKPAFLQKNANQINKYQATPIKQEMPIKYEAIDFNHKTQTSILPKPIIPPKPIFIKKEIDTGKINSPSKSSINILNTNISPKVDEKETGIKKVLDPEIVQAKNLQNKSRVKGLTAFFEQKSSVGTKHSPIASQNKPINFRSR